MLKLTTSIYGVEFDPKEVTLSADKTLDTSQMILTLAEDVKAGSHEFTVLTTSSAGTVQKLTVTVSIATTEKAITSLNLS